MKWVITIIALILLGIITYIGYVVFASFTDINDVNSCVIDNDCIVVDGVDVCKTPVSINKNYAFRWNKKVSYTHWLYELTGVFNYDECEKISEATLSSCEKNTCMILGR
ncbi:hypothetical protein COV11_04020 [Candidatus Woesearchaeota archaeon CG10_big_fil_rev_8_21_14_0_10_30_7]|nr:MAG: hypothetical protein COV11_04020 [Candidatus Woesearchaeota archaeon CG10_big_fil_rev_8_21_14_0_10_30_7]